MKFATFTLENPLIELIHILEKDYSYDSDGKYKKQIPDGQITFQIIESKRFSHTVCVYAIGKTHKLIKNIAKKESNQIMSELAKKISLISDKRDRLNKQITELHKKSSILKQERDSLNARTQDLISSLKEIEEQIDKEKGLKKKKHLSYTRMKVEKKLIKNKKLANQKHDKFIQLKKDINKLKKRMKK